MLIKILFTVFSILPPNLSHADGLPQLQVNESRPGRVRFVLSENGGDRTLVADDFDVNLINRIIRTTFREPATVAVPPIGAGVNPENLLGSLAFMGSGGLGVSCMYLLSTQNDFVLDWGLGAGGVALAMVAARWTQIDLRNRKLERLKKSLEESVRLANTGQTITTKQVYRLKRALEGILQGTFSR